ncbi:MAG: hypothetical protein AAF734_05525, partial [Bacteroidota bacterium]
VDKKQYLIGNWKLTKLEIPTMEQAIQQATPNERAQLKQELATMMRYAFFEFKADGTYHIIFGGDDEKGKWRLNPYGSKLYIQRRTAEGTYEEEDQIGVEVLEKKSLIILNEYDTGEVIRMALVK